jgi:hypothetical protein
MELEKIMSVIDIVNNYEDIIKKPIYENWAAKVIQKWWHEYKIVGFFKLEEETYDYGDITIQIYAYNKNKHIFKVNSFEDNTIIIDRTKTYNFDYIINGPTTLHYIYDNSPCYVKFSIVQLYYCILLDNNEFKFMDFLTLTQYNSLSSNPEYDRDIVYGRYGYGYISDFQDNCRNLAKEFNII